MTAETNPRRKQYVASVDLGTTSVRCFLYDLKGSVKSSASEQVSREMEQIQRAGSELIVN